jgi:hypothetical protein
MFRARSSTLLIVSSLVLVGPVMNAGLTPASAPAREFIETHCTACHNDGARTAGLTLSGLDNSRLGVRQSTVLIQ